MMEQVKRLRRFATNISQNLDVDSIVKNAADIIKSDAAATSVYVLMREQDSFETRYITDNKPASAISISFNSPLVDLLDSGEGYVALKEFKRDPIYREMPEDERKSLAELGITYAIGLKCGGEGEKILGIILIDRHVRGGDYDFSELNLLVTVAAIASIALRGTVPQESRHRQTWVDSLTGLYNYKRFISRLHELFADFGKSGLSLMYVDVDEFSLYNQLYGVAEGDLALMRIADKLSGLVGADGSVFRCGDNLFALLLPNYNETKVKRLAQNIEAAVGEINEDRNRKRLTASIGICVSPNGAASAKELMENAQWELNRVKNSGKNQIRIFKGRSGTPRHPAQRAVEIVTASHQGRAYQANAASITALTAAINAKDHYTCKHSRNVAMLAATLSVAAGMNEEQTALIYDAGMLHDVGKISIPDNILCKPDRLTDEEFEIMKGHVNASMDVISNLPSMEYVVPVIMGHHERWDGKGYPRGISGTDIPLPARCLSIADAFDAMTTERVYKPAFSFEYAAEQIERSAGIQFDPELVDIFVKLVRSGEIKAEASEQLREIV
jgi:diguanylate cyclase (GGDEF)-like protein